jgi:hypothetical protein
MEKTSSILPNDIRTDNSKVKSILMVVPLSRKWTVELQAKQIAAMHRFTDVDIELLVWIDNEEINNDFVVDKFEKHELPFAYTVRNTGNRAPHEVRLFHRRDRIRDSLTQLQQHIRERGRKYDLMFMVEDDTIIQQDALYRLLMDYKELTEQNVKVGLIEGVQVGRHGIRMIGAWRMDDLENPTKMSTIPLNSGSLFEKIDGGGLYCFITPMELFLAHTFYWAGECFSVDVTYGIELRKKGYTNIIDWSVITGHTDQNGNVLYPNDNVTVAAYEKQADGEWKLQPFQKGNVS